jgi:hypothetical protein
VNRDGESNGSEICFLCAFRTQFSPPGALNGMFDVQVLLPRFGAPLRCQDKAAYLGSSSP